MAVTICRAKPGDDRVSTSKDLANQIDLLELLPGI